MRHYLHSKVWSMTAARKKLESATQVTVPLYLDKLWNFV